MSAGEAPGPHVASDDAAILAASDKRLPNARRALAQAHESFAAQPNWWGLHRLISAAEALFIEHVATAERRLEELERREAEHEQTGAP